MIFQGGGKGKSKRNGLDGTGGASWALERENSELGGEGASVLGQDFQVAWPGGHHTLQRACRDSPKHEAGAGWGELPPTPPLSPMFRTVKENSSILPKATPLTSATAR